jgi:cell division inhibitor SulA/protein ImuA
MNEALAALLQEPGLWRGEPGRGARDVLPTGFDALGCLLPGGGWPLGVLTELLLSREGAGELQLLMPGLARLTREGRQIVWIDPPHLPYAPALTALGIRLSRMLLVRSASVSDRLWAVEQALGAGACGAVLTWLGECEDRKLRRLQLAAERGGAWGILFRPAQFAGRPSPAALRLKLEPAPGGLAVQSLKGRGGRLIVRGEELGVRRKTPHSSLLTPHA